MAPPIDNSSVGAASGFRAQLRGISIADLIQLNCLSGGASCVRVASQHRTGCLHFADGQITHAIAGEAMGEDAVLTMLEWQDGCLEPASEAAVTRAAVTASWQNLLLRAAQRHDEAQTREESGEEVPMTQRVPVTTPSVRTIGPSNWERSDTPERNDAASGRRQRDASNYLHVRVNTTGKVTFAKGEVEELTALVSFATHMGQMIGDQFALERLVGIEVRNANCRTVMAVTPEGQIEAIRSTNELDLSGLRQKALL